MKVREEATIAASHATRHRHLRSVVVRDTTQFASLEEEWDELYRSCPSATPFSSWEWLFSWWQIYGEVRYTLRLVTLRNESGLLVGLLPLMARRGRLSFLGNDVGTFYWYVMTPYKDVLVREGWEEEVARAAARALKEMGGWRVADLQELMPHSAAWHIFRHWRGPKTSVPINDYVLVRAESWEELLASLSKNLRSMARRTLRRAEQDRVICRPAEAEDAERAASTLVELHRELWRGRQIDPEDLTPRYEAFMRTAARRMTARGLGRISEFRRQDDGEVLVSQFLLFDKDFVGVYVVGASEEATRRYQFMTLCNWDAMNVASSEGGACVSWMHYISQDKLRWASEVVTSHRAILGRGRVCWIAYANYYAHTLYERYHALLSDAQVYVHSDEAPRWIKKATQRYYAFVLYPYSEGAPGWISSAIEKYYALRTEYGYYALRNTLRYRYELARARREIRSSNSDAHTGRTVSEEKNA